MGVTGAQATVDPTTLESAVRDVLNLTAPRRMVVVEPVKVTISNFSGDAIVIDNVPDFPVEPEKSKHKVVFDKVVYIEASDFKEVNFRVEVKLQITFCNSVPMV